MKKIFTLTLLAFLAVSFCKAQYVTIPDSGFVFWLNANGYDSCMNGNKLDTNCTALLRVTTLDLSSIGLQSQKEPILSLDGLQYFKNVDSLIFFGQNGDEIAVPSFPANTEYINMQEMSIPTWTSPFPPKLKKLVCVNNFFLTLSGLPNGLQYLDCDSDEIDDSLPSLPSSLKYFSCRANGFPSLPSLPSSLDTLLCDGNGSFTSVPTFPSTLKHFSCSGCDLQSLPALPDSMTYLNINGNFVPAIPHLPNRLIYLIAGGNSFTSLPNIPNTVIHLELGGVHILSLPPLPDSLDYLDISDAPLTCLPKIGTIDTFIVSVNGLSCLQNYGNIKDLQEVGYGSYYSIPICSEPSAVVSAQPAGSVCFGTPVTFTATPDSAYTPFTATYSWFVNGTPETTTGSIFTTNSLHNNDKVLCELSGCNRYDSVVANVDTTTLKTTPGPLYICPGSNVQLNVSGGTGAYTWSPSTALSSSTISNPIASPGSLTTYMVSGKSPLGCNIYDSIIVIVNRLPSITDSVINPSCGNNNGSISLAINGGTPPVTYLWNKGETTQNINNLKEGSYCVTVTDTTGCSASLCDSLVQAGLVTVQLNTGCGNNSVSVYANNAGEYNLTWSGAGSGSVDSIQKPYYTINGLTNNSTLLVTIYPLNGCPPVYDSITVGHYSPPSISLTITNDSCNLKIGSVVPVIDSGAAPYAIAWSVFNDTTAGLFHIGAGNYSLTVTDARGCTAADTVILYNISCSSGGTIQGVVYLDNNHDCIPGSEPALNNVKVKLYQGSTLVQQAIAFRNYSFTTDTGTYTAVIDTTNLPFNFTCPSNGDSTVSISGMDTTSTVNFGLLCKQGFDIGVWNIHKTSYLFPGLYANVLVDAGDIASKVFNISCNTGAISGQMTVIINGPVDYTGYATGSLQPNTTSGDTLVWNISDFSSLTDSSFNFVVLTQPAATLGAQVCVDATVTINSPGDRDSANNHLDQCFIVSNSFDPNEKEVSPAGPLPYPYNGWLTYTIHFQNTGTAAAENILVRDTLDSNLSPETFQLLAYSAKPEVNITGRYISFSFPNINLPDTAISQQTSQGYVQYRIQPIPNLPLNSEISNSASIYFDFNSPIKTNTVSSQVLNITGINKVNQTGDGLKVYPNPASTEVNVILSQPCLYCVMDISDVLGRTIMQSVLSGTKTTIDISSLVAGIYFLRVSTANKTRTVKVVKN